VQRFSRRQLIRVLLISALYFTSACKQNGSCHHSSHKAVYDSRQTLHLLLNDDTVPYSRPLISELFHSLIREQTGANIGIRAEDHLHTLLISAEIKSADALSSPHE
jgi:hypothetical protein